MDNFIPGWRSDPPRVLEIIQERSERGDQVYASQYTGTQEPLVGAWERAKKRGVKGIFLRERELVILAGKHRRPFLQNRGVCVADGMTRGVQTSLDVAIADNAALLRAVEITMAPTYSLARHEVGRDRCGSGDGAILGDAAKAVNDWGVAEIDLFHGMTQDQIEALAVHYAAPGVGTPAEWIKACKGHTADTFNCESLSLIFDCIASDFAVPYAHSNVTSGSPNSQGICGLGSYGPHCRCFTGVFVDDNGHDQLVSSESWGRFPAGQPSQADKTMPVEEIPCITLHYGGGLVRKLAPGDVGVIASQWWEKISNGGESWAVAAPRFEAESLVALAQK